MAQPQNPHPTESSSSAATSSQNDGKSNGGLGAGGLDALRRDIAAWREGPVAKAQARIPQRHPEMTTWSGLPVPDLVTPAEKSVDYRQDLGLPGEYPFTRGSSRRCTAAACGRCACSPASGRRADQRALQVPRRPWTEWVEHRLRFPTLMGYDSDSPRSLGEVGMCGVAVDTSATWRCSSTGCPSSRSPRR